MSILFKGNLEEGNYTLIKLTYGWVLKGETLYVGFNFAESKTGAKIVPKEESDMYIAGYRDGHDDATKTARWIKGDDYVCDYCGYHMAVGGGVYNYCPSCGKRMLGEDGEEE